jgi:hypothetical protein
MAIADHYKKKTLIVTPTKKLVKEMDIMIDILKP